MAAIDRRECINITFVKSLNERNFQFSQWKSGYSRTTAQFNAAKVKDAKRSEQAVRGSLPCIAIATAGLKEAVSPVIAACSRFNRPPPSVETVLTANMPFSLTS